MVKSLAEATDMLLKSLSVKELKINAMPYHVATLMGVCDAHLHYAHIMRIATAYLTMYTVY